MLFRRTRGELCEAPRSFLTACVPPALPGDFFIFGAEQEICKNDMDISCLLRYNKR